MQSSRYARGFSSQSRGTLPSDSSRIYLPKDHTKIGTFSLPALSSSKQQTLVRIMDLGPPLRTAWVRLAQCARSNVQSNKGAPSRHVSPCVLLSYRGHSALTNPPSALASRARKTHSGGPPTPGQRCCGTLTRTAPPSRT